MALRLISTLQYRFRPLQTGLLLILSALMSAPAYAAPPKGKAGFGGIPVKTAPVRVGPVVNEITAIGTLRANESVVIRPELGGRVAAIHFKEGSQVTAGDKLVSLDASEYEAKVAASSAEVRLETMRYERASELIEKNVISQQMLDEARENLARAQAQLAENKALLDKTTIKAPFSGLVGLRHISPGDYIQPGQDIVTLEDISVMKLDFRIPEIYLGRVRDGLPVEVQVDAYSAQSFTGKVYAFEPGIEEKSRTILLRARLPATLNKLRPGMFARVKVILDQRPRALLVPEQSIVPKGQETFVFRVVEGKAQLTKVRLGLRTRGEVEVLSGLNANDQVITDGQLKVQDGAPVSIFGAPPPADQAGK